MRYVLVLPLLLAACGSPSMTKLNPFARPEPVPVAPVIDAVPDPEPRATLDPTPPPPPPARARTVEQFDTTTAEDRAEALAVKPEPAAERKLGTEVASLGAPTDPGIWVKTPLVKTLNPGRVEVKGTGKSANIELRAGTGGTQISLAAMRLLDIPLTDLPELVIYAK